jgi:hypothetical protein
MNQSPAGDHAVRVVSAWLKSFGDPPTRASVTLVRLSPLGRLRRALMALALPWAAAGLAIFMPVVHFALVPTLLGTGVVLAILMGREHYKVASVRGTCPRCRREQEFSAGVRRLRNEQVIDCPRCHTNLILLVGAVAEAGAVPAAAPAGAESRGLRGASPAAHAGSRALVQRGADGSEGRIV